MKLGKGFKAGKTDFFLGDTKTPLDNAYDAISIYLESGRSDLISEFSFGLSDLQC